jgi:predicted DNA-binding protein
MATKEDTKAMTLRLSNETAKDLEATAKVDGVTVSEAVREAIETHIENRRNDTDFRDRLKRSIEENKELLERLAR